MCSKCRGLRDVKLKNPYPDRTNQDITQKNNNSISHIITVPENQTYGQSVNQEREEQEQHDQATSH